jgi:hypothetical protein
LKQFDKCGRPIKKKEEELKEIKKMDQKYKTENDIKTENEKKIKSRPGRNVSLFQDFNQIRVTLNRAPNKLDGSRKQQFPIKSELMIAVIKSLHMKNENQWNEFIKTHNNERYKSKLFEDIQLKIKIHKSFRYAKKGADSGYPKRVSTLYQNQKPPHGINISDVSLKHQVLKNIQRNGTRHNFAKSCSNKKDQFPHIKLIKPTQDNSINVGMFNAANPPRSSGVKCRELSKSAISELENLFGRENNNFNRQRRNKRPNSGPDRSYEPPHKRDRSMSHYSHSTSLYNNNNSHFINRRHGAS